MSIMISDQDLVNDGFVYVLGARCIGQPAHHGKAEDMRDSTSKAGGLRKSARRNRQIVRACICLLVILCGLALRKYGFGIGLPGMAVKYGGSVLWGTMVFLLLGVAAPRLSLKNVTLIAI